MFDVLLRELATRFGLGEKARELLGALLALIFDPASGGFNGFIGRLRAAGLGAVVDSWLGRGENHPVTAAGIESAFGPALLEQLAGKTGFTRERTAATLTALLPSVLDKLTPDAVLPAGGQIPAHVQAYLAGQESFAESARGLWPSRLAPVTAPAPIPAQARITAIAAPDTSHAPAHEDHHHATVSDGGMGGSWIAWAALALIAIGSWMWLGHVGPAPGPAAPTPPALAPPSPAAAAPVTAQGLVVAYVQDNFTLDGRVPDDRTRTRLLDAARLVTGQAPRGNLTVDPQAQAPWAQALLDTLPQLAVPGLQLELAGPVVDLVAVPPGSDPAGLEQLELRFAGLQTVGWFDPSVRAFAALEGDGLESTVLAAALNQMQLHFEAGGHVLRGDSRRVLERAAAVLRRAQPESMLEVGGYVQGGADALASQNLSEARAYAVVEALVAAGVPYQRLVARGHGTGPAPVSERIEFKVLR